MNASRTKGLLDNFDPNITVWLDQYASKLILVVCSKKDIICTLLDNGTEMYVVSFLLFATMRNYLLHLSERRQGFFLALIASLDITKQIRVVARAEEAW